MARRRRSSSPSRRAGSNAPASTCEPLIDEVGKLADEAIKKGTKKADYYEKFVVEKGETTVGP